MSEKIIISGSSNSLLAYRVARELNIPLADIEIKKFPDGEKYVRINYDVVDKHAIIVQSGALKPDEYLIETLLIADALNDLGSKQVSLVFAYFPYARQDERFKPGEAISLVTVTKLLKEVGIKTLITVDAHRHRVINFERVFGGKVIDVSAMPYLSSFVRSQGLVGEDVIVIGPDAESEGWAKLAAEAINASDYGALAKRRISPSEVEVTINKPLNLEGRDVLLVDDIISTGGTMIEAIKLLRKMNVKSITVACTHGLFVNNALMKILRMDVKAVVSSDTVPNPTTKVSVAPAIARAIKELNC